MTDYTRGPWHKKWGSYVVEGGWFILPEGEDHWQRNAIAEVQRPIANPADADLIAAAPDLLEALLLAPCHKANYESHAPEPTDFWVEEYGNKCPRCAAIAKARGQS